MEIDLHLAETDKSIDEIKKILKEDVFGNYNVVDTKPGNAEFGIFLFQYNPNQIILKLDYMFHNYADVSIAIMQAIGKILQIKKYYVIGLKVESPEAFVRLYQYTVLINNMVLLEDKHEEEGSHLTPIVKEHWGIDLHDIWGQMEKLYNGEVMRQCIKVSGDNLVTGAWIKKYGSLDNIDKRLCETMYFVARQEIEKFRPDPAKVKITRVKLGRKVMPN